MRGENIDGYFALSTLESAHTTISPIIFYNLCSLAAPAYPKPLLLENNICIIALMPDLQRVLFYSMTEFLYHSSSTKLILSSILIIGLI